MTPVILRCGSPKDQNIPVRITPAACTAKPRSASCPPCKPNATTPPLNSRPSEPSLAPGCSLTNILPTNIWMRYDPRPADRRPRRAPGTTRRARQRDRARAGLSRVITIARPSDQLDGDHPHIDGSVRSASLLLDEPIRQYARHVRHTRVAHPRHLERPLSELRSVRAVIGGVVEISVLGWKLAKGVVPCHEPVTRISTLGGAYSAATRGMPVVEGAKARSDRREFLAP
jgi:hypothetical protein